MLGRYIFEALPTAYQAACRRIVNTGDIEKYLDEIALELYPRSRLLNKSWLDLFKYTAEDLLQIVHVVTERVQKFARVARRRSDKGENKMGTVTTYMIGDAILPMLPAWAQNKLD